MILYAPIIELTTPAFTTISQLEEDSSYSYQIKVNFKHNPAVDSNLVESMNLQLKSYNLNGDSSEIITNVNSNNFSLEEGWVIFVFDLAQELNENNYYKVQIKYNTDNNNPWSNASIAKYISYPILMVNQQFSGEIQHTRMYYGTVDGGEAIKSYRFVLYSGNTILEDSGDLFPNGKTIYNYLIKRELPDGSYKLIFSVKTINGYEVSQEFQIKAISNKDIFNAYLVLDTSRDAYDNGYINIVGYFQTEGKYQLIRTVDDIIWEVLNEFDAEQKDTVKFNDFTVEQGVTYTYALRKLVLLYEENGNQYYQYTEPHFPISATADFDSIFLTDGTRQLRVAFNPKVSSFKETILESKTDTIGSKYPFIFRNGDVRYKEIPISGLLSYQLDTDYFFMDEEELGIFKESSSEERVATTNLVGYNFIAERKFKLAVLEWLNNGQPKLFRSPAEGNYIIRTMNTSLSPQDTLNRMIHTFNSTGYEVASNDWDNLLKHNLIFTTPFQQRYSAERLITQSFPDREDNFNDLTKINSLIIRNVTENNIPIEIDNNTILVSSQQTIWYQNFDSSYPNSLIIPQGIEAILDAEIGVIIDV